MVLFCWAAFLSISLLASVFPVSLPLFFLFFRPCLIHARLPEWGRAFVHGLTFLHSWSGPMTVVIGLLHGATTFLSGLPLVLFVSFIRPKQLERTLIKSLLIKKKNHTQALVEFPSPPNRHHLHAPGFVLALHIRLTFSPRCCFFLVLLCFLLN